MAGARWRAVAALVDPLRRALYEYVRRQPHPVTREEAAKVHAVSRNLAAFHLDRLVDAGLLRARYEAPADQPRGRGRTPKVYEPAGNGVDVSVPQRRYELVGEILTDAIAGDLLGATRTVNRHAHQRGWQLGRHARSGLAAGRRARCTDDLVVAHAVLADLGFEPRSDQQPDRLMLGNCPFHALAVRRPELICGINRAFIDGILAGLGTTSLTADLLTRPGACCVEIRKTPAGGSGY